MAYTADYSLALGLAYAGLTDLRAQLVDTAGSNTGGAIATVFVDHGNGFYQWHYTAFPDGHRGGVKFYSNADSSTTLAFTSINPETLENVDAKVSTRATDAGAAAAIGARAVAGAHTYDEAQRLLLASQGGKTSGAGVGPGVFTIQDVDDTKAVVLANYDVNGNRTAVTLDLTP